MNDHEDDYNDEYEDEEYEDDDELQDSEITFTEPIRLTVGDQPSWSRRPVPSEEELKEPAPAKAKQSEKLRAADTVSKQQPPVPPKTVIQKCTVKGYALEAIVVGADDKPMTNVAVEIMKNEKEALSGKTDIDGWVRFVGLENGSYDLSLPDIDREAWALIGSEDLPPEKAESTVAAHWQAPGGAGPKSETTHVIVEGECISELAYRYGFVPDTLWDWPENEKLKEKRKIKNILDPGDEVVIPGVRQKKVNVAAGKIYRLRRKGYPEVFQVRFLEADDKPRVGVPYLATIKVNGLTENRKGKTNIEGYLIERVPPDIDVVEVALGKEHEQELYSFQVAYLDPIETIRGLQARLGNFGYPCGDEEGKLGPLTKRAIQDFQQDNKLDVTGAPDDATLKKLEEVYGS